METALATIETMTAVDLFKPGALEPFLHRTRTEVLSQASTLDISTPHSRAEIASLSYKVGRTKTFIDGQRKSLVADEKKRLALIDAEGKKSWDFLEALQKEVRKPLTDWENADKERIALHEQMIAEIEALGVITGVLNVEQCELRILAVDSTCARDFEEFTAKMSKAKEAAYKALQAELEAAKRREEEQAELVRLRAESAAREQKEREERIAREAVENERRATIEAEARAKVAEEARIAAEARHAQELKDAAARAEQEAKAAVEAQKAADKAKADAKKAEAARREESTRIVNRVHKEIVAALMEQEPITESTLR